MILVTGAAGFIGFHVVQKLLARGDQVVGLDNLNDYYDVRLKQARLDQLKQASGFIFQQIDVADREAMEALFSCYTFTHVCHLAAQAGVRYSIDYPHCYVASNVTGFLHILEGCRSQKAEHLVYASTSSVYGAHTKQPFNESDHVDHPLSLYAATKKANELMAHTYSHLHHLPTTGLRFFTVYGPWGRPDMALFLFTKNILAGRPIDVFNHGKMIRDFTYIDDIAEGVIRALDHPAAPNPLWDSDFPDSATSSAPYRIYNIGNSQPVQLMEYIHAIEKVTKKTAICNFLPMQDGDVPATHADITKLECDLAYRPKVSVTEGVSHFVHWYLTYYVE